MANVKRANTSGITKSGVAIPDVPDVPTIGSATAGLGSVSVAFTPATTGGTVSLFTATSNPGSITATSATSPITVSGLAAETSYSFTVRGANSTGTGPYSPASNSASPLEVSGAYDALATVTVGATAVANIEFAGIPNTYKHLQFRCLSLKSANPGTNIRINGDATAGNYPQHILYGTGTAAQAYADTVNYTGFVWGINDAGSTTAPVVSIIDILDYTSTTKLKTIRALGGADTNGDGQIWLGSGMNKVITAPITSITFNGGGANFNQYTQFTLYGVR